MLRETLQGYLAAVRTKILCYLDGLTDDGLYDIPTGCTSSRLGLILSQFRHFYAHLGNINATTIIETNRWPVSSGRAAKAGNPQKACLNNVPWSADAFSKGAIVKKDGRTGWYCGELEKSGEYREYSRTGLVPVSRSW